MNKTLTIRPETRDDFAAVENLTREAFWNVYQPGCDEHFIVHRIRSLPCCIPELSLVLEEDGEILAHILYCHAHIDADDGRKIPIVLFGPLSVRPDVQRRGYGSALVRESLARAAGMGLGAVCITGNFAFYSRFGFTKAQESGLYYENEREKPTPFFMVKELIPGYLSGVTGSYTDPDAYHVNKAEAEAFDAQFPPKEKLKLPGQIFGS